MRRLYRKITCLKATWYKVLRTGMAAEMPSQGALVLTSDHSKNGGI